jgi:hypothetical protein
MASRLKAWWPSVLISTVVIVMITAVGVLVKDLWFAYLDPLVRYQGGGIVKLPPLGTKAFDLFLSHAQNFGQDQVATIKLTLEKLLPKINIFLDVEALDDLHMLTDLVANLRNVLVFLTQGCLQRHFVRLEVTAAAKLGVQTIVVQETDPRHGSVSLARHHEDCPEGAREHLFGAEAHDVILWYRANYYKPTGIRQIVQQLLVTDHGSLPGVVIPGEISQRAVKLPPVDDIRAIHFWLPNCAPWCTQLKHTLEAGLPGLVIGLSEPGAFAKVMITKNNAAKARRESCVSGGGHALRRASLAMQNLFRQVVAQNSKVFIEGLPAHAMLVPLNAHTLQNPAVQDDLFEAIQAKMQVVLLHMQEEEFQAVPFAEFFEQCPDKLRDAGLFDTPARVFHFEEPYCTVSTKLVGMGLELGTARNGARNWESILEALVLFKKTPPTPAVFPVDDGAPGAINTPSYVAAMAPVDDEAVDATLGDEALK